MAFLPEDVRSQQRVLGIVVLMGAAALYCLRVHAPRRQEATDLRQRIERLEHRTGRARVEAGDLDRTRAELNAAERLAEALGAPAPRGADAAQIYEELAARSEALGLEVVSVVPVRRDGPEGARVRRLRWDVVLEGRYHDLGEFLARMASLHRVARPAVRSIGGLGSTEEGRHPVRADVSLEIFLPGEGDDPPSDVDGRVAPGGPTTEPVFAPERETYVYPRSDRRNPFRPPTAIGGIGPRFQDLRLSGILYGPGVGGVAVLRDARTGGLHRLREGDRIGDGRLVELRPERALFVVAGPAGSRRELLRVYPDRGPGGPR